MALLGEVMRLHGSLMIRILKEPSASPLPLSLGRMVFRIRPGVALASLADVFSLRLPWSSMAPELVPNSMASAAMT